MKNTKQRLNLVLPGSFYKELLEFADALGYTPGALVRWMFGVAKLVYDELRAGHRVAILDRDGKLLKEVAVPR